MGNCIGRKNHFQCEQQPPGISILDLISLSSKSHRDEEKIITRSLDTSPSFSSLSLHSSSFSSDDQLILPSSSSSSEQIYLSSICQPISTTFATSLPHRIDPFLHTKIIAHQCSILRSVIDDVIQQQSIRIHRQTTRILLEYRPFHCIPSR